MKKKTVLIATLALVLGVGVSGCYVERESNRPYYDRYDRDYGHDHRDHDHHDRDHHDRDHRGGDHDEH